MNTQTPPSSTAQQPGVRASRVLLAWTAPSHFNHERSARWYLISGVLVISAAAYGVITGNWSVTLVSLLLGGVYFLTRHEAPPLKAIRIETDGVQFQDSFIPWAQCKDFWLIATPLYTELHIMRKGALKGEIRIQTGDISPLLIRSTLSQFLTMRADQRERFLDIITRLCKL